MSNLRDLLIDIRLELRKLVRDFQKTDMRARIDEAVSVLGRLPDASLDALGKQAATSSSAAAPESHTRNRVALAWQAAAADLRLTDPAIYDALRKNALQRLASRNPQDLEPEPAATSAAENGAPRAQADPTVNGESALSHAASSPEPLARDDSDDTEPTLEMLTAVAAGSRPLSDRHREWCVGEAMVVSDFQISPIELIAQGDSAIAQMILDSREGQKAS